MLVAQPPTTPTPTVDTEDALLGTSLWHFMPLTESVRQQGIDSVLATHADLSGANPGIHFIVKSGEDYRYLHLTPWELWCAGGAEGIVDALLNPTAPSEDQSLPPELKIQWHHSESRLRLWSRCRNDLCHLLVTISNPGRSDDGLAQLEPLTTYQELANYVFAMTSPRFWLTATKASDTW